MSMWSSNRSGTVDQNRSDSNLKHIGNTTSFCIYIIIPSKIYTVYLYHFEFASSTN